MVFLTSQFRIGLRSTSVNADFGFASTDRAHMHGRRRSGDDEMVRISADLMTADSGRFPSGDLNGFVVVVALPVVNLPIVVSSSLNREADCSFNDEYEDCKIVAVEDAVLAATVSGTEFIAMAADALAFCVVLTYRAWRIDWGSNRGEYMIL